ncbi:hypothetical protein GCM10022233_87380 [Streptomyces shaanxiensis]|uniref:Uncharacterized protein n=1 Tax=Streptomyces shaanxiensis TaxID=653357 RepID=A0ABP7WJY6_9ACTN
MPDSPLDSHICFDVHPAHSSAVTARLTGTQHQVAQALLTSLQFRTAIRASAVGKVEYKRGTDAGVIHQGRYYLS